MEELLVSIITPTYNCASYIAETIESVQNQTYQNWEMIIVDDCSQDNTSDIVHSYLLKDSRIKYERLSENHGAAFARNKAMCIASGAYMAFLDSDDLWLPNKLKTQIEYMQTNQCAITCTKYECIDENGVPNGKIVNVIPRTSYNRLLLDCPVGNSTVMYDVTKLGKFKVPDIRKRNDFALWLQILKKEKYAYGLNEPLVKYRIRKASLSRNKLSLIKFHWELYRDIEHLGILHSVYLIIYTCIFRILKDKRVFTQIFRLGKNK